MAVQSFRKSIKRGGPLKLHQVQNGVGEIHLAKKLNKAIITHSIHMKYGANGGAFDCC